MRQSTRAIEANRKKSGAAVVEDMHNSRVVPNKSHPSSVMRMPSKYNAHDLEVLLDALWTMFTDTQARKLVVLAPWDDEDPQVMTLGQVAETLEHWLEEVAS